MCSKYPIAHVIAHLERKTQPCGAFPARLRVVRDQCEHCAGDEADVQREHDKRVQIRTKAGNNHVYAAKSLGTADVDVKSATE